MNQTWENRGKSNKNLINVWLKFGPLNFYSWVLPLLDVRHCRKLSFHVASRKIYDPNSRKWQKFAFWIWFRPVVPKFGAPNFSSKNLASSFTKYHGQLSLGTISGKVMIQSSESLVTDRRTDGREQFCRTQSD